MRMLLVAQDSWGLGHVARQLGLARELRRRNPEAELLFLTYSDATQLIATEGFPSIKLPYLLSMRDGAQSEEASQRWFRMISAVVHGLVTGYQPTTIIVDTFPIGLFGELQALLDLSCPKFLIAREVRNAPEHWQYEQSLPRFDALFAPYAEGEVELPFQEHAATHWVGPVLIRTRKDLLPRIEARRRLGLPPEGRCCYVSFGGGGNEFHAKLEDWVFQLVGQFPDWRFVFAAPPLLKGPRLRLEGSNAERISYFPMAECFAAFDAAISMTGSSAYELAHMGVPSILVPSVSPHQIEDHRAKAERILGENGGFVVPAYDTAALAAAFSVMNDPVKLEAMKRDRESLNLRNGAETAAEIITRMTQEITVAS